MGTVAGTGAAERVDGPGNAAAFHGPYALAIDKCALFLVFAGLYLF